MAGPLKLDLSLARRFWLAYLGLAAAFGVAVGTFIVLAQRPAPGPPPPWSSWRPRAIDVAGKQREVAAHVGARYQLASGSQLVKVYPGVQGPADDPIRGIALARTLNRTSAGDVVGALDAGQTAMYTLCGDGDRCAIAEGKPSIERFALLRREALELTLYTLRYIPEAQAVVVFFPPAPGDPPTYAFFMAREWASDQLQDPLRETLRLTKPPPPEQFGPNSGERRTVDELTGKRVFRWAVDHDPNGLAFLVLAPSVD